MIKVIINADDLGKSHEVNIAIQEALVCRCITSSTILANSGTWDEIHDIVNNNPQASFGVHLNLTEGRALTNNSILQKYNVVDAAGYFTNKIRDLKYYPQELIDAISEEFDAQINKVKNIEKITISHIDGHHHIHTFYPFTDVLIQLLHKYNIKSIRNRYYSKWLYRKSVLNTILIVYSPFIHISKKRYCKNHGNMLMNYCFGILENYKWRKAIANNFISLTEVFDSYEAFCKRLEAGYKISPNATIELMCHPGHYAYSEEYGLIKNNMLDKYLDFSSINYNQL